MRRQVGFPFLALGIAFGAFGMSSPNKTFIYVGVAFIVVSLILILRGRR